MLQDLDLLALSQAFFHLCVSLEAGSCTHRMPFPILQKGKMRQKGEAKEEPGKLWSQSFLRFLLHTFFRCCFSPPNLSNQGGYST